MNWYTGSWAYVPGSAEAILYADSHRLYDARMNADTSPLNCAAGPPTVFPPVSVRASPCLELVGHAFVPPWPAER